MSESIKMRGILVLYDKVDDLRIKIPKDCKLSYPEVVPLAWNFDFNNPGNVLGNARVSEDDDGLICDAVITNGIDRDMLRDTFHDELPIGGYYRMIKEHRENNVRVMDELSLVGISVTLGPASDEYKLVLVEEEIKDE